MRGNINNSQNNAGYAIQAKDGFLGKYKNFLMGWGTKYVKLDRSYLHNFDARDAPNPSGSLVRGQIARCSLNQSFKGAAGPYVFDVICKNGTTWYLRAKSWEEMADWMLSIFPDSKYELDRLREGTSQAILNPGLPHPSLPPPIIPQQTTNTCEFGGELPVKNPNSNLPPGVYRGEEGGGSSSGVGETFTDGAAFGQLKTEGGPLFPPSYSDLFDKHDPAVQGKK